jgi:hypothetical protein
MTVISYERLDTIPMMCDYCLKLALHSVLFAVFCSSSVIRWQYCYHLTGLFCHPRAMMQRKCVVHLRSCLTYMHSLLGIKILR